MARTFVLLIVGSAVTLALQTPLRMVAGSRAPAPIAMSREFPWDSSDFLNDPVEFLSQRQDLVNEDLKAGIEYLIAYERQKQATQLWGDLPQMLDLIAMGTAKIQEKSLDADALAAIIARAEPGTVKELAQDATFAEKKVFFEKLAALPEDARGLLTINALISSMRQAGELPLMDQFEGDLQYVTSKAAETNQALSQFYQKYTTLFLSLRKVSIIANAAAQAKYDTDR